MPPSSLSDPSQNTASWQQTSKNSSDAKYRVVSYDGSITQLDDGEALLSFDYVMVNGHESSIPVAVEIYDGKTLIANTGAINVPIVRNRLTTVRGKFLTSRANEGVGIDPGFDGDFNIEIK